MRLMIPGPVTVEEEVLREMGTPVQAHYGHEWTAVYNETRELLKDVFRTQGDVHILVGSGSAGLDAAIGSMAAPGETIVVGRNGFFGQRLVEIGRHYALNVVTVDATPGEALDPSAVDDALARHPEAAALAVVCLETSTTVVNPIAGISAVARRHNRPLIVDAVSSLGGVPLEMDEWGIDICISASQKCLGAPPGLAPVAVSPRAWEVMASKPRRGHGWYLNLENWQRYADSWGDWHPYPVTMPTSNVLALRAGLRSLLAEGLEARIRRYTSLALRLREGVRRLGLRPFTPDDSLAPVLTAVYAPEGVRSNEIVRYLLEAHQIKISGGLGPELGERIFRIGHMGGVVGEADIDAVLEALAAFLQRQ
jgi:alanine-glyoxylate transaminase/serine-glyoxylate transaminase/serine-pyruvate transaminase